MKRTINNKKRFEQPLLFEGLENGAICYTDIDFILEVDNHTLIVGECKTKDNPLTKGQELVIRRLCDKEWMNAIGIVVEHNIPSDQDIMLKDTTVRKFYMNSQWNDIRDKKMSYEDFIKRLTDEWKVKKLL
jgi:hypothetical protein